MNVTFQRCRQEERHVNEPMEADWLPIIGPTAWLLGSLLTRQLEVAERATWDIPVLARRLGVGKGEGKDSPVPKAIGRLIRFRIITEEDGVFVVRRGWGVPPKRQPRPQPVIH